MPSKKVEKPVNQVHEPKRPRKTQSLKRELRVKKHFERKRMNRKRKHVERKT